MELAPANTEGIERRLADLERRVKELETKSKGI